jgi:aryl carrier-like protein
VFYWDEVAWRQRGLDIDGEAAFDQSGYSVSLSSDGSIVAIGATGNGATFFPRGHVRVFYWDEVAWRQRGADIDGERAFDASGFSVSLSSDGTIVAIGATGNNGNGVDSGHVRVFYWDEVAWRQRGADIDGEARRDESGWSVSLSSDGSVVVIGAPLNDGIDAPSNSQRGHVRVFTFGKVLS